jgi:hypothetical protein
MTKLASICQPQGQTGQPTHVFANVLNLKLRSNPSPLAIRAQRPPFAAVGPPSAGGVDASRACTSRASFDSSDPEQNRGPVVRVDMFAP